MLLAACPQGLEDRLAMIGGLGAFPDFRQYAIRSDDEGSTGHAYALAAVQHFLAPGAVAGRHFGIGIDQEGKVELVLGDELLV